MSEPLALLVDGDNISAAQATALMSMASCHGHAHVRRAYLDLHRPSDWQGAVGFRLVHTGSGKNATDILLALDAAELLYDKGFRRFLIATSDADFRHLALRLREAGAHVLGAGDEKAPATLRASMSEFFVLGASGVPKVQQPVPSPAALDKPMQTTPLTDPDLLIRAAIARLSTGGQGITLVTLSQVLHKEHGITIKSLGFENWRAYLTARPLKFDLDPKGPEAKVRFRPAGFLHAA